MDKVSVYEVKITGIDGSLIYADRAIMLDFVSNHMEDYVEDLEPDEVFAIAIRVIEMTQDELDKLEMHPDFE